MSEPKATPLYDWHVRNGGRMVDFAGWSLPVQFGGIVDEVHAVRQRAGLFDVSHMGEIRLRGAGALATVQKLATNDASVLDAGRAQYTVMANDEGGIIDDMLLYRIAEDDYSFVVNAATRFKDLDWIHRHIEGDVEVIDESDDWALLAVQGPRAADIVARVIGDEIHGIRSFRYEEVEFEGRRTFVSRTGYTGEDGFEIYVRPEAAVRLADLLLEAGEEHGLLPVGLGARDTLRLEAGLLLYGTDMDETRSPVEAGLRWVVKPDKGDFIGRDALSRQLEHGVSERLAAFRIEGRGIPRHGYSILDVESGDAIGVVTSGTFSPTLQVGIGLGYLPVASAAVDGEILVDVRGRKIPARVVKLPFYRRETK